MIADAAAAAVALMTLDGWLPMAFSDVGLGVIRDGGIRCCCCCCCIGGGCTGNACWALGVNAAVDCDGNVWDCNKIRRCRHFFCCCDKWKVGNRFGWSCNSDCNCGWILPVDTSSSGLSVKIWLPTIPLVGLDEFDVFSIFFGIFDLALISVVVFKQKLKLNIFLALFSFFFLGWISQIPFVPFPLLINSFWIDWCQIFDFFRIFSQHQNSVIISWVLPWKRNNADFRATQMYNYKNENLSDPE